MAASTKKTGTAKKAAATPWGPAAVVQQVRVPQRAGDRAFATVLELLEIDGGEPLVRIAYTTDGVVRRGPVTLRRRDLQTLRRRLQTPSPLVDALGLAGGDV